MNNSLKENFIQHILQVVIENNNHEKKIRAVF